jgi:hypothetical protein
MASVPINIAAMRKSEVQLVAETVFGDITFGYRPYALSDEWLKAAMAIESSDKPDLDESTRLIAPVIAWWDIQTTDQDGNERALPVTFETLRDVTPLVRNALTRAVMAHAFQNAGKDSATS